MKENRLISYTNVVSSSGVGATVEVSEIESLPNGSIIIGDGAGAPTTLAAFSSATGFLAIANGGTNAATASAAFTNLKQAASTTDTGVAEASIASEVNTGTDTLRYVSPDSLAGSNLGTRVLEVIAVDFTTDMAVGDGKAYITVPASVGGMDLVGVHARNITAGTTGTCTIQIANVTQAADMLTTKISMDSTETGSDTAATPAVIDAANDDVAANDLLRVDIDTIHTTAAKGLIVTLEFRLP